MITTISDADRNSLRTRAAVASTLVACLELARQGEVGVEQPEPFDPIRIRPRTDPLSPDAPRAAPI